MEWGDKIEFLEDVERDTGKRPQALSRRVMPDPGNALFWRAFQWLSKARSGFNGDITGADILAYVELHRIRDIDLRSQLARIIPEMDAAFLEWMAEHKPKPKKV